jgi:hypothetical protein
VSAPGVVSRAAVDRAARARFLATAVLLVAARAADAYTTYLATPDLSLEANPLERLLHVGWSGLLVINAVVVAVMIVAARRAAFAPPALPSEPHLDLPAFVGRFWFSRDERRSLLQAALYLPADRRVRWAFIGGPGAVLVIAASAVIAISNLLIASDVRVTPAAARMWVGSIWGAVAIGLMLAVRIYLLRAYARYLERAPNA